jgi:integrase
VAVNKLADIQVKNIAKRGLYGDGAGLWLQVSKWGTKTWVFRYMLAGKARTMGLGRVHQQKHDGGLTLAEARQRRDELIKARREGKDPIAERRATEMAKRAAEAKLVTFKEAADRYIKAHAPSWRNAKHSDQWRNTLETYAHPVIGPLSVAEVDTAHVMQILEPIWTTKTETATRVRGRIESVLDWAKARHFRSGDNPARWRGHLDKLLPARAKVQKVKHHPALPYVELPGFMKKLRAMDSISARALEFTILAAVRTGETIGAKEGEIDFAAKVWTVPGERMKSGRDHRVPLSDRAIEILQTTPREKDSQYLFPGGRKGKPLSNMAMAELLKGMACPSTTPGKNAVPHGFRSTFRDWAAERTNFPRELAEAALAHVLADKTEAAYQRGDLLEKRRRLMREWARFCESPASAGSNRLVSISVG